MNLIGAGEFENLFLRRISLIDVRAPGEFAAGSVPRAVNLPLLNDEERHEVGLIYKKKGQTAAIKLGHELIQGGIREERISSWVRRLKIEPDAAIFCFRGGLRSQISQEWLYAKSFEPPRVEGGFKALRRYLLNAITTRLPGMRFEVVSGPTGAGKTAFLKASGRPFLDLEELANHRGSAFGETDSPQPSQIDFENAIAAELIRLSQSSDPVLIEDESRMVGLRAVPSELFEKIRTSPVLEISAPLEERVENIFKTYVLGSKLGLKRDVSHFQSYRRSVTAISRKLGGARAQEVLSDLRRSEAEFRLNGSLDSNREWIRKLLLWYYDPRYSHSMCIERRPPL